MSTRRGQIENVNKCARLHAGNFCTLYHGGTWSVTGKLYVRTRNEPKIRVLFDKMFQLFQKAYTEAFLNFGAQK